MATLYLGYRSAIEYWRAVGVGLKPYPAATDTQAIDNALSVGSLVLDAAPQLKIVRDSPIDVLVPSRRKTYAARGVRHHLCTNGVLRGSLCRIDSNTLVASPALCLLHAAQMTRGKSLLPLIELCSEFLGGYSLCDGLPRGFMQHSPFIGLDELYDFMDALPKNTRSLATLRQAVQLVIPGSRSPRETSSYLLLSLPEKLGGFAFPQPKLNLRVDIRSGDEALTDKEYFLLDLYWENTNVAFEYDGSDHSDPARSAEDKARRNLLSAMGYKLVVVEKEHVSDARLLNQQIALLARMLGVELATPSDDVAQARAKLRNYLFDPHHYEKSPITRPIELLPLEEQAPVGTA